MHAGKRFIFLMRESRPKSLLIILACLLLATLQSRVNKWAPVPSQLSSPLLYSTLLPPGLSVIYPALADWLVSSQLVETVQD